MSRLTDKWKQIDFNNKYYILCTHKFYKALQKEMPEKIKEINNKTEEEK